MVLHGAWLVRAVVEPVGDAVAIAVGLRTTGVLLQPGFVRTRVLRVEDPVPIGIRPAGFGEELARALQIEGPGPNRWIRGRSKSGFR